MSVLVCAAVSLYPTQEWRWWRVLEGNFWDVFELKEAVKWGGHGKLLHHISPHQLIRSEYEPNLQPTDVGKTGDGV